LAGTVTFIIFLTQVLLQYYVKSTKSEATHYAISCSSFQVNFFSAQVLSSALSFQTLSLWLSWRWRQHGSPNLCYPTATLHGVTARKTSNWVSLSLFFMLCI